MTASKITITDGKRPLAVFVRTELAPEQDPDEYDMHAYPNHLPRWGIKDQRDRAVRAHERSGAVLPSSNHIEMAMNRPSPVRAQWFGLDGLPIDFKDTGSYADVARIKFIFPGPFEIRGDKLDFILDGLTAAGQTSVTLEMLKSATRLTN